LFLAYLPSFLFYATVIVGHIIFYVQHKIKKQGSRLGTLSFKLNKST